MKKTTLLALGLIASFVIGLYTHPITAKQQTNNTNMKLGAFSVSLSVKDIKASKQFYENLGFVVFGGSLEKNYLIMKNGKSLIGLFQGMFEGNILTFNPGWDENAKNMDKFDDVREIQRQLKNKGVKISNEIDEKTSGPASIMITDPDGNVVLIDQHR
jgi:predicted enzyme related to lactoylglutathione lyase